MLTEFLVLVVFPALLALAAGWDLATYLIPNWLSAGLVLTFILFAAAAAMPWTMFGYHVLAGALALTAGFALFGFGVIGGGDAKLFAAIALMLGFHDLAGYALLASLFGGALTLAILALRRFPLPQLLAEENWIVKLHDAASGVPYGVALATGAVVLLPHAEIFRLAAGG
ncbi:MAG: prepilin peptidase [Alphaproteobacteria bacterium]|nr:prepilin peptidase [Alphaproteobacteria bacterium]MBU6471960.1 prepilin peptidase [Alphaproteobacteria bacterium]MDE2013270.1 prepilin peptidase [Alphaproteobacteria bacterium]MDE2073219.1 prepilin peptidase [Alphaproteobacteria bacterium]MDE2353086.1 prepilin peptidase [Alphaproteobacteria bacterium]